MNFNRVIYRSKSVSIDAAQVVIMLNGDIDWLIDKDKLCFVLCQAIPAEVTGLPVILIDGNGVKLPLWDRFGNILTGENLKTRVVFKTYIGEQDGLPHILVTNFPVQCY